MAFGLLSVQTPRCKQPTRATIEAKVASDITWLRRAAVLSDLPSWEALFGVLILVPCRPGNFPPVASILSAMNVGNDLGEMLQSLRARRRKRVVAGHDFLKLA